MYCDQTCLNRDGEVDRLSSFTTTTRNSTRVRTFETRRQYRRRQIPKMAVVASISLYLASCCDVSSGFSHNNGAQVPLSPVSNSNGCGKLDTENCNRINRHQFCSREIPSSISNRSGTSFSSSSTRLAMIQKKKPMPIVGYSGEDICSYYDMRPLVVGWRLNSLSLPLLGKFENPLNVVSIDDASYSATNECNYIHCLD